MKTTTAPGMSSLIVLTLAARFQVQATGFFASDPADESRPMKATGMFTATRE